MGPFPRRRNLDLLQFAWVANKDFGELGLRSSPNFRTSFFLKLRTSPNFRTFSSNFQKMLYFGKIRKKFGQNLAKVRQNSAEVCKKTAKHSAKFNEKFEIRERCRYTLPRLGSFVLPARPRRSFAYRWTGVCRLYQACVFFCDLFVTGARFCSIGIFLPL